MRDAQELMLLSALQECRLRLAEARSGATDAVALRRERDAARERIGVLEAEIAAERERTEAVRTVLGALAASVGRFGLRRSDFLGRVAAAGRESPESGPGAARHPVLLAEARRVLGVGPDGGPDR